MPAKKTAEEIGEQQSSFLDKARSTPVMELVLEKIREGVQEGSLLRDKSIIDELRSYLEISSHIPKSLNHKSRKNISQVQNCLHLIEGRLDRALFIQDETRTVLKALQRWEYEVKQDLFRSGITTEKTSKPSVEQLITIVIPELLKIKDEWKATEVLCREVHNRLNEAKETIKIMQKLDDNFRWANREK